MELTSPEVTATEVPNPDADFVASKILSILISAFIEKVRIAILVIFIILMEGMLSMYRPAANQLRLKSKSYWKK